MKKVTFITALAFVTSYCFAAPQIFFNHIQNDEHTAAMRPVKFTGFSAALKNSNVSIQWSASEKAEANMYELERSADGINWKTIAYFGAIGNSEAQNQYSFTDKSLQLSVAHYRVKEVDIDGQTAYTSVQSVRVTPAIVSPVTISAGLGKVILRFTNTVKGDVLVQIVRSNGLVASEQTVHITDGKVELPTTLKGNYFVSVSAPGVQAGQQIIL